MAENPATAEDAAAGLLNGLMISLLGSAFPVAFIWQLVSRWKSNPIDLSLASLSDVGPVFGLAIFSLLFVRTGVRLLWENLKYFRRRPGAPSPE
ncbi:hypothetical protein GGQ87_001035 [Brevundimonas alba]|uniref:Uncharacterized protein n=1 Tax=Brevundimonas alba TaxID=74314 RepID=A0A7X6BMV2_9CAUL|nr:hypothetical protein [Brevundimonas alba]NJC40777.1 hypothetical protein [Brevundimonas alba]